MSGAQDKPHMIVSFLKKSVSHEPATPGPGSVLGWHEGAYAPWFDYFWSAVLQAYKKFEERIGTVEHGRIVKGEAVRADILKKHPSFLIPELVNIWPSINRKMRRLILGDMKTPELMAPPGKDRAAKRTQIPQAFDRAKPTQPNSLGENAGSLLNHNYSGGLEKALDCWQSHGAIL